jgi:hypothetical protein
MMVDVPDEIDWTATLLIVTVPVLPLALAQILTFAFALGV